MLHRWIIRPLAELAAMIIRLAEGDRSVQIDGAARQPRNRRAGERHRGAARRHDRGGCRRRSPPRRAAALDRAASPGVGHHRSDAGARRDDHRRAAGAAGTAGGCWVRAMNRRTAGTGGGYRRHPRRHRRAARAPTGGSTPRCDGCTLRATVTDIRIDELNAAMDEVAGVVTAIQEAVNEVPQITLSAMRDLAARTDRFDPPRRGASPGGARDGSWRRCRRWRRRPAGCRVR